MEELIKEIRAFFKANEEKDKVYIFINREYGIWINRMDVENTDIIVQKRI